MSVREEKVITGMCFWVLDQCIYTINCSCMWYDHSPETQITNGGLKWQFLLFSEVDVECLFAAWDPQCVSAERKVKSPTPWGTSSSQICQNLHPLGEVGHNDDSCIISTAVSFPVMLSIVSANNISAFSGFRRSKFWHLQVFQRSSTATLLSVQHGH